MEEKTGSNAVNSRGRCCHYLTCLRVFLAMAATARSNAVLHF